MCETHARAPAGHRLPHGPAPRAGGPPGRAAGGFDVQLDYAPAKYLAIDAVVRALCAQLARAGARAHPRPYSPAEQLERIESHDTSFYVLGWRNESGSAHETYDSLLHSPRPGFGAPNGGAYSNPDLDALLESLPAEPNQRKRVGMLRQATAIVAAEVPPVPLYR